MKAMACRLKATTDLHGRDFTAEPPTRTKKTGLKVQTRSVRKTRTQLDKTNIDFSINLLNIFRHNIPKCVLSASMLV